MTNNIMNKAKTIVKHVKSHELSWSLDEKYEYLKNQNLNSSQLHEIYCLWHSTKKSLLRGKKAELINQLAKTMNFQREWNAILNA